MDGFTHTKQLLNLLCIVYISRVGEGSSGVKDRRAGSQTHSINSATSSSSDIPPGRLTQTSSVITSKIHTPECSTVIELQ